MDVFFASPGPGSFTQAGRRLSSVRKTEHQRPGSPCVARRSSRIHRCVDLETALNPTPTQKARSRGPFASGWGTWMTRRCAPRPSGVVAPLRGPTLSVAARHRRTKVLIQVPQCKRPAHAGLSHLAGGLGFEPRLAESESAVLPLDDPPNSVGRGSPRLSASRTACRAGPCGDRPSCARPHAHRGSRTPPRAAACAVFRRTGSARA